MHLAVERSARHPAAAELRARHPDLGDVGALQDNLFRRGKELLHDDILGLSVVREDHFLVREQLRVRIHLQHRLREDVRHPLVARVVRMQRLVDRKVRELVLLAAGRVEVRDGQLLLFRDGQDEIGVVLQEIAGLAVALRLPRVAAVRQVAAESVALARRAEDDLRLRVRRAELVDYLAVRRGEGSVPGVVFVVRHRARRHAVAPVVYAVLDRVEVGVLDAPQRRVEARAADAAVRETVELDLLHQPRLVPLLELPARVAVVPRDRSAEAQPAQRQIARRTDSRLRVRRREGRDRCTHSRRLRTACNDCRHSKNRQTSHLNAFLST